jgi:hypothetical protein
MTSNATSRYQVGGALLQDVASYVTRESDSQLFEALKMGDFCYVLNSRQMGKSSLMVRTLVKLLAEGWKGAILDFSAKDSQSDQPNFWYNGIINDLNKNFQLLERNDFLKWIKEREFIAPVERLGEFIETVLLPEISQPIVIFVDEIDSTLGLPFTDDFFALIRACYNKRAEKPDYKRLTFALLGVAAPSDLIGDTKRTPFNIGKSIDLSGFTLTEAQPLADGFSEQSENPKAVLEAILYWTGGQPFLSQRLCQLVADSIDNLVVGSEASVVERLVQTHIIQHWESQDDQSHLKTISQRILRNNQKAAYLLELYRQIRQAVSFPAQNRPEEQELQLTGIVVKRNGNLKVYNPIYAAIFDESWIDAELGKLRPYAETFRAWIVSGKADKSRLLRGVALEDAEKWAREKNLSGEDRDFLAASRTQLREEEIANKEREAELERERKDKKAAEEAQQILAKANEEGQKRLRQRTLIGTVFLGAALTFAGVSANETAKQVDNVKRTKAEAEKVTQEATQKIALAEAKVANLDSRLDSKLKDLKSKQIELTKAEKEAKSKKTEAEEARKQASLASKQAQQAENAAHKAQLDLGTTNQKNKGLLLKAEQLILQAQDAARNAEKAQKAKEKADKSLKIAQDNLDKAKKEQKVISENNKTVEELSSLFAALNGMDESEDKNQPEAAKDVIAQIALSFTDFTGDKSELKKALLKSSITLAYLRLDPQDKEKKAQAAIEISIDLIKNNPALFNSKNGRPIAFFSYAVWGNLLEEKNPKVVPAVYQSAFSYAGTTYSPTQSFNLTQDEVEKAYINLLDQNSKSSNSLGFRALATASLKKHYEFREKQAIQSLETFLVGKAWKKADGATTAAILASAYSKNLSLSEYEAQGRGFLWYKLSCSSLRKIDELWSQSSAGRFGFKSQKEIWQNNLSPKSQKEIGQNNVSATRYLSEENLIRFSIEVGWKTKESGVKSLEGFVSYDKLMGFKESDKAAKGNLPAGIWGNFERARGEKGGEWDVYGTAEGFFPHLKKCNL